MISAQTIEKSYNSLKVLNGVSLEVQKQEIVAIIGKSGAGKSTLLHILGTLDKPDAGKLIINEQTVNNLSSNDLAKFRNQHIGFIFQFHHLLPEFTALENVCLPAFIANKKRLDVERKAKELLDYLGLSHRLEHKPNQLSGGEQQRVSVARALINQPALILADEPSGNLDTQTSSDLHQLFFKLRADFALTFVVVTHNLELANMCDRCLTMKDGQFLS